MEGHFRVGDPDELARLAERNPGDALLALRHQLSACRPQNEDWRNALAQRLATDPSQPLRQWAEEKGLRPDELSRGFRAAFGVSPKLFRLEMRTRQAWGAIVRSDHPFTQIAQDLNFSDLAHMSRSIHTFTGHPPRAWREFTRRRL